MATNRKLEVRFKDGNGTGFGFIQAAIFSDLDKPIPACWIFTSSIRPH